MSIDGDLAQFVGEVLRGVSGKSEWKGTTPNIELKMFLYRNRKEIDLEQRNYEMFGS